MKTFIVTIVLPGIAAPQQVGCVTILTPTGAVENRIINQKSIDSVHDVHTYSADLIKRMYPAVKMHGSVVKWEGPYETSGLVTVVAVEVDS